MAGIWQEYGRNMAGIFQNMAEYGRNMAIIWQEWGMNVAEYGRNMAEVWQECGRNRQRQGRGKASEVDGVKIARSQRRQHRSVASVDRR